MLSVDEALHGHRYVYFGGNDHPVLAASDNLMSWQLSEKLKDVTDMPNPSVACVDHTYYIASSKGMYTTSDFFQFEKVKGWPVANLVGRPTWFQDNDDQWYIVYATSNTAGVSTLHVQGFDFQTGTLSTKTEEISFYQQATDNSWQVDPSIARVDGIYYLATAGNYLFSSNKLVGPYQKLPTNFGPTPKLYAARNSTITGWLNAPQLLADGDSIRLLAGQPDGQGLVFRSAEHNDLRVWADTTPVHLGTEQLGAGTVWVNKNLTAEVPAEVDDVPKFNPHMYIRGVHSDTDVPLTCYINSSAQYTYEDNQTNQLQFVAYNDGSPSFTCIVNESIVTFNDDYFVIKNIEEDQTGSGLFTVTAIQYVNSEIGRVRQRNIRQGKLTYTINDVLNFFLNDKTANPFGFSFHTYGDFDKQQIENLGNCSGKDMVSKIVETWPGTIIVPFQKRLDVFAPGALTKNHNRRIVYKYNSSNMKLTEDSTNIVNQIRCIGATKDNTDGSQDQTNVNVQDGFTPMVTGYDHTAEFQADAKKYLGVRYVWGGHNKANPWAGMDCSGYVSQVYHDFGIEIPAYTVSMEHYFREIPRDQVKAGDVGFWGPHGGTDHIVLFLDHNTMIYEPEPGQSCKTATVGSYHPDWYARSDAMQAKINSKKIEMAPTETINVTNSYSSGTVEAGQNYYFQPFIVSDENSINQWGLHPGADLQDDRFHDPSAMRDYAITQLSSQPTISIEVVMNNNEMPIIGEQRWLTIPGRRSIMGQGDSDATQDAYTTTVTAVGFTWYPFDESQGTDVTFNNLPATLLHSRIDSPELTRIEQLANETLDRMPQIFYSNQDPSANQTVRNGAIWIKPIGGETNGGQQPEQPNDNGQPSTDQ